MFSNEGFHDQDYSDRPQEVGAVLLYRTSDGLRGGLGGVAVRTECRKDVCLYIDK